MSDGQSPTVGQDVITEARHTPPDAGEAERWEEQRARDQAEVGDASAAGMVTDGELAAGGPEPADDAAAGAASGQPSDDDRMVAAVKANALENVPALDPPDDQL